VEPGVAFGRVVRKRRTEAGLSQERLGFEAGLGRVFVSWIETGQKQPTFRTILKLAAALGCSGSILVAEAEALLNADETQPEV